MRYTFGAQLNLDAQMGVYAIQDADAATQTGIPWRPLIHSQAGHPSLLEFADNCLTCHISAEPLPGDEYARSTGCAACHSLASGEQVHTLTSAIPYTQCKTCYGILDERPGIYTITDPDDLHSSRLPGRG